MKKLLVMVFVFLFAISFVAAKAEKPADFCTDSDSGIDIWNAGYTTTEKGLSFDDCDGASENLKEYYCDEDKEKHDNIKCSDYNAVCISVGDKSEPDYCACDKGYVFDDSQNMCVEDFNEVPEFGVVAAGVAMIGALGIFLFKRK